MVSISTGIKKRGETFLYDNNFTAAIECFFRVYLMEPEDTDNIIDLIYALNQNGDYASALTFAYAYLGKYENFNKIDHLYFLTAEAFGGAGCIEGCVQMLERCIEANPDGAVYKDAVAFLKDVKEKYEVDKYDKTTNCVAMSLPNAIADSSVLNYETLLCVQDVTECIREEDYKGAIKRIEEEIKQGNVTVTILTLGIMLGYDMGDREYILRCAQRFKYIEDYTGSELFVLAGNLTELDDNEVAYSIYRELYGKESGEKQIAFGFAVACERADEIDHAYKIAKKLSQADGGRGPAQNFLDDLGDKTHSYIYKYEGKTEEEILDSIYKDDRSTEETLTLIDYLAYAPLESGLDAVESIKPDRGIIRSELRRAAINPSVNLLIRTQAAKKINDEKCVYLNTGADIIEYSPEIENAINKFFERGNANETVD